MRCSMPVRPTSPKATRSATTVTKRRSNWWMLFSKATDWTRLHRRAAENAEKKSSSAASAPRRFSFPYLERMPVQGPHLDRSELQTGELRLDLSPIADRHYHQPFGPQVFFGDSLDFGRSYRQDIGRKLAIVVELEAVDKELTDARRGVRGSLEQSRKRTGDRILHPVQFFLGDQAGSHPLNFVQNFPDCRGGDVRADSGTYQERPRPASTNEDGRRAVGVAVFF